MIMLNDYDLRQQVFWANLSRYTASCTHTYRHTFQRTRLFVLHLQGSKESWRFCLPAYLIATGTAVLDNGLLFV